MRRKKTPIDEEEIREKEYYKTTCLFGKTGLLRTYFSNVFGCWDFLVAIIISVIVGVIFLRLTILAKFDINKLISDILSFANPIYLALLVIFVTSITVLFTFHDKDKYMELIRKTNTYNSFIFIPYWNVVVAIVGFLVSLLSSLIISYVDIAQSLEYSPYIYSIILFVNLFFMLYIITLTANLSGTLVRHGIYKIRYLNVLNENTEKRKLREKRVLLKKSRLLKKRKLL